MKKLLIVTLLTVLAACGETELSESIENSETPGTAVISDYLISNDEITVVWTKNSGADAESWNIQRNELLVCSARLTSNATNSQQTGSCVFALLDGVNSIYVQLCNESGACSNSATLQVQHTITDTSGLPPGDIYFDQLAETTSEQQLYVKWIKQEGINGDYWRIYHNGQSVCGGYLTVSDEQELQSAGCIVDLPFGDHELQARLCIDKPIGVDDVCTDSEVYSLTSYFDSGRVLATPVIEALDASLPAWETSINWSKDTQDGSAGESWTFYHNNSPACIGTLTADERTSSCTLEIQVGANSMYVQLCTDVDTYSGATCSQSELSEVEGIYPYALDPGEITITSDFASQTYEQSLIVDWEIGSGTGVTEWYALVNGSEWCRTTDSSYLYSGSCSVDLALGSNSISIVGCNYGVDGSSSCGQSAVSTIELLELPGAPRITNPTDTSTYNSAQTLSWVRDTGASAERWFGTVNGSDVCWDNLSAADEQSAQCSISLVSGYNELQVRICVSSVTGAEGCVYSEVRTIELLADIPGQPVINTESQILDDDEITINWSNSGIAGSSWHLTNNASEVANCGPDIQSSGSTQSGSCSVSLSEGANAIAVTLCNVNDAGTQSCTDSDTITIERILDVPAFTSADSINVAESPEYTGGVIYTPEVQDNDSSSEQIYFSLLPVDDYALFALDRDSGAITPVIELNHENDQSISQNNVYLLQIEVYDETGSYDSMALQINITNVNEAPVFTAASVALITSENNTSFAYTVAIDAATDEDQDQLTYGIAGTDSGEFDFDSNSRTLSFKSTPNHEAPLDNGGNNTYELDITVSDGEYSDTQALTITVSDINEAPVFAEPSVSLTTAESNTSFAYTIALDAATDEDLGQTITYAVSGTDIDDFDFDSNTRTLSFKSTPDHETPLDDDGDNLYELQVTASDGQLIASQDLDITVLNVNEAPVFIEASVDLTTSENNTSFTYTVAIDAATDEDQDELSYGIAGTDSGDFNFDSNTRIISFKSTPNHEAPLDNGGDNTYELDITVSDGEYSDSQALSITVSDINEAPVFTEPSVSLTTAESDTSFTYTVAIDAATDEDPGQTITYAVIGTDIDDFDFDSNTRTLSFKSTPDHETPLDDDGDNLYELQVTASDGQLIASQELDITVLNVNEAPIFTEASVDLTTSENNTSFTYTVAINAATDEDQDQLTYGIAGTDSGDFNFDSTTRTLSFKSTPNHEAPLDNGGDNTYELDITVSDGEYSDSQALSITVSDVNEAPIFTEPSVSLTTAESDTSFTYTVAIDAATDEDPGQTITYAVIGTDIDDFDFDSNTRTLSFKSTPDHETPLDDDGDNLYELQVTASDGQLIASQDLDITVLNVNEAPVFTAASVDLTTSENNTSFAYTVAIDAATDEDQDQLTYGIAGTDSGEFNFDSNSRIISFKSTPNHEAPLDNGGDNTYELDITVSDGEYSDSQALSITVSDINEAPIFTEPSVSLTTAESDTSFAYTVAIDAATDEDPGQTITYAVIGTDIDDFDFDSNTRTLSFKSTPDHETPLDDDGDNLYELQVTASDGQLIASQELDITVLNVNEAPVFTVASVDLTTSENNTSFTYTVAIDAATDEDQDQLTYGIAGTDSGDFKFDSNSRIISFKSTPNHEAPLDNGGDNIYELDITVSDGEYSDSQALSITVSDINEAPIFTEPSVSLTTAENNANFIYLVEAGIDEDQGEVLTYELSGTDETAFSFAASTRELSFAANPDYEIPADQDINNVYQVIITTSDGEYQSTQDISISVTDLNDESPQFTSPSSQTVDYSTVQIGDVIYTAQATDADAGDQIAYSLGGTDAANFDFAPNTAELSFNQLPELEDFPAEGGIDYQLTITATDLASNSKVLDLSINLLNDTGSAPEFDQASVNIAVDENSAADAIYTAQATDVDPGDTLSYSISGVDHQVFSIDSNSGELSFNSVPDFENPTDNDQDNTYQLTITATDSVAKQDQQSLEVAVTNLNDNQPQFNLASDSFSVAENSTAVTTIAASDADGDALTYSLVTSAYSSLFSLDSSSGALSFNSAPDFESPLDDDTDNTYELELSVFDGSYTITKAIIITVTNIDEAPSFTTASESLSVNENTSGSIYQAQATDPEQATLSYSASGTDASLFTLNSSSGELSFNSAPDYETPLDAGADNIYQLEITASDGSNQTSQSITVTVTNLNEPHSFTSTSVSLVSEENNASFAYTVEAANDPDQGQTLTYQLSGTDQSAFNFDPATRELSFKANPDYENPADQNNDNTYQISIVAFDADHSASQDISISVEDLNDEAPQFTSLSSQAVNYTTAQVGDIIYTAQATDADAGDQVTYALGGTDTSFFTFNTTSGALAFAQLPSLTEFQSSNGGIVYALTITATDLASNSSVLDLTINLVDDTGNAPEFTQASANITVDENIIGVIYQASASDADGDTLVYSIEGIDSSYFSINSSSAELSFISSPDYEQPEDSGLDNTYELSIIATDPIGNQGQQSLAVSINNLNDNAPQFNLSSTAFSIIEGETSVATITAQDADGDDLTFSLTNTTDSSFFSLDPSSGVLAFASAPDFESAQDSNSDNTYELELSVFDGSHTITQEITITVTNIDESPSFASATVDLPINENTSGSVYQAQASDPEQANLIYSASGTDAGLFDLDSASGELAFKTPPDYESPTDNGANNTYNLDITASDGANQASQAITITVTNINEAPSFATTSVNLDTAENNASFVHIVEAATDPDSGEILSYQLGGTDQSAFNFDPDTRELSFKANPDYELPADQNTDNTYQVDIIASDGEYETTQSIAIAVTDFNDESPQFTSLNLQTVDYTTVQIGDIVYTAQASDADAGDQITYTLGGADAANFNFDSGTGELSFNQLPNLEDFPTDGGIDYQLSITATDLAANSTDLALTISLLDDTGTAPTFDQANVSIDVDENIISSVYTAQATDVDVGDTLSYSISDTDSSLFTIDPSSGDLSFNTAPDFEAPDDSGTDNTYDLSITATDSIGKQASQSLSITVTNVNEAPTFTTTSVNLNTDENDASFTHTVDAADDPDQGETLTYQLSGDDAADFNFDTATRALSFKQAPDFESPTDQNTDNAYQIDIIASDADYSTTQAITIAVANVEENPYFHSTTDHVEITEDPATEGTVSPVLALTIQAADDEDDSAGTSLNFAISGGADSDKFSLTAVNNNSANLSFAISPDFDNPHDANLDSNYSLSIEVADSSGAQAQHDLIVQVLGVNDEVPQLSSGASADVNENSTAIFYVASATDADRSDWSDSDSSKHYQPNLDSITFSLDSANYPDSSFFAIGASSGELQAASGLDYESPQSSAQSNYYTVAIELADSADNRSVNLITVTVIDDPDEPEPVASSGPQIPWFYSDVNVGESIDIPWVIYSGDGAIDWTLYVNGDTVCSESASISAPVTSGVCSVSSSYLNSGSTLNNTAVSVTYSDSSSELSEEVSFAYAASSAISFPSPSSSQAASACASVDVGDVVNATNNSACYDYLLGDDDFGGPHDQVPSYLDPANGRDFEVIAYFIEWGIYSRDFQPADLPANLLSTALFSFVKLKGDDSSDPNCETCSFTGEVDLADGWAALSKSYDTDAWCDINYEDWTVDSACKANGIFKQFWLLKQKFPHLKTCVSVGGWSFSRPFPLVGESATMRATFADSIVDMAEKYHFDCIDIDWEFPIIGGGDYKVTDASGNPSYDYDLDGNTPFLAPSDNDAQYFADLIQELRSEIDSRGLAIDINSAMYSGDYGMSKMDYNLFAGNLHGIHMMTYDFYGAWDPYTGMQAALFPNSDPLSNEVALQYPDAYNNQHNIASAMARAVNNAIDNGFESNTAMRRKIVPGLAFYGRNYSGVSTTPVPGAYMVLAHSAAEQLSWEQGNLNYVQLKGYYDHGETLQGNGDYDGGGYNTGGRSWTYNWDDESQTPFLYDSGTQSFVSYTDPRGIFYQTCHAARENSKGVMFWEISGDSEDSQLVNAIHAALRGDTLSQYGDQPHCDDIIGYGAASSTSSDDDDDGGSGNDDGGGNDDDGGDTGGGDTGGDTSSGTSGLQELEDLGYFTETVFNSLFYNTTLNQGSSTDGACTGYSFFNNWLDLKEAATYYPDFAAEGSMEDRLRELAAFLANTSHETTGAWQTYALDPALGARYHYGYCFKEEVGCENQTSCTQYCDSANTEYGYACSLGTTYHGRGPIQFTWNYNYGPMSEVLYGNNNYTLLENPSILVTDAVISYRSALWFWMTVQAPKPSAHDVMIGNYSAEASKNRYPGFGMTINIINGGLECGTDDFAEAKNKNRLGFYLAYLKVLGDAYGSEISPWVTESSTSITYGSTPANYSAFDLNEADLISRYTDVETYLSCKNMEHY